MLPGETGPRPCDLALTPRRKFIFYPCIPYERTEFPEAINHYNCPIVTSYAENIKNNVDELQDDSITFRNPFLAFTSEKVLADGWQKNFPACRKMRSAPLSMPDGRSSPLQDVICRKKGKRRCSI